LSLSAKSFKVARLRSDCSDIYGSANYSKPYIYNIKNILERDIIKENRSQVETCQIGLPRSFENGETLSTEKVGQQK